MKIVLNGEEREVRPELTIAEFLAEAGYLGRRVAIEVNRAIVPRSALATVRLAPGDRIEIVHAIGGG
ncbi:MAG: sulfur carrier protein ThiS [Lysobacterales bacterium]